MKWVENGKCDILSGGEKKSRAQLGPKGAKRTQAEAAQCHMEVDGSGGSASIHPWRDSDVTGRHF